MKRPEKIVTRHYGNGIINAAPSDRGFSHRSNAIFESEYTRSDIADARVAASYEAAAQEVDCGCKCRDAVLAAETKVDRWYACAQSTCAAMSARDIRALTPADAKAALEAVRREERQFGIPVAAALAAAISLLERGGKQAAASDKMFDQMLTDYQRALNDYRALIDKEATE